jgi:filamentous hemagglutinin family protein
MNGSALRYSLVLIGVCSQLARCAPCLAQPTGHVVLDGTLGTSGPLSGPNYNITSDLGKIFGKNLFQSFSQFDLVSGEVATFSGPATIHNILARVTGGSASSIDGTIQSSIQGANLFFINPFGVLFGPHAQVNVSGSFAVTSASYVKLADGGRFDAANPANDVLTAAPVSAFGFLGSTPGNISFQQSSLAVPAGQSFSVIGGNISLSGATIQAPGGRINLISVNSPGELALDVTDLSALPNTSVFSSLGQITVQDANFVQSTVDASGTAGGQVVVRGGSLMVQNSVIEANTLGGTDGKGINIDVTGGLTVDGGVISTDTSGSGNGGPLNVTANSITLNAEGNSVSGILSDSEATGTGNGGDISVTSPTLSILNGARISAATGGSGNGGNVTVNANSIDMDAQSAQGFGSAATGIFVSSLNNPGGSAGSIVIRSVSGALSLQIVRGAQIAAETDGSGAGGSINIIADSMQLDGETSSQFTGIDAMTFGSGQGGDIQIQARALTLANGSQISAATFGNGGGGDIMVNAATIAIQTSSSVNSQTFGLGAGGNINLTATTSLLLDGRQANGAPGLAEIAASNPFGVEGDAPAGNINITTPVLEVLNGADISASVLGASAGGNITINTGALTLDNRALITCSSQSGQAGGIAMTAAQTIQLSGASVISVSSADNNAGDIKAVSGGDIRLTDSQITAQASQDGGNITLTAPSTVYLLNSKLDASAGSQGGNVVVDPQSVVLKNSTISSSAGSGNGGDITLEPAGSVYLLDGTLNAQSASGNGGDILVAGPKGNTGTGTAGAPLVTLNQADVIANAPKGQGGNITFVSKGFLQSGGLIDASGAKNGTVEIRSPNVDLTGIVVPLPASLLDAQSQLQPYCGLKLAGAVSSFLVVGRGGVPLQPSGVLPSLGLPPADGGIR